MFATSWFASALEPVREWLGSQVCTPHTLAVPSIYVLCTCCVCMVQCAMYRGGEVKETRGASVCMLCETRVLSVCTTCSLFLQLDTPAPTASALAALVSRIDDAEVCVCACVCLAGRIY